MTFVPEIWRRELAGAFEVLLGKPLDEFPAEAEYVLYHWDDMRSSEMVEEFIDGEVDLSAVVRGEPIDGDRYDDGDAPFGWTTWSLDLGRSVWLFEESAFGADGPFGEPLGTALAAASAPADGPERELSGADFARALAAHGEDLDEVDGDELTGLGPVVRIATDGTLFDAMRTATWTTGGPDDLIPFLQDAYEIEVEPEWEEKLRRIPDHRLRDHLRMLCLSAQSARSDGGYYLGPRESPAGFRWMTARPGHEAITGWEFGEGQGFSAIVAIT
ncbi:hypothetical protein ABZ714_32860 [Streptomyces sp. NPDC006798]|uniref:hypothetical protein n=1 Tax=Streptomyces sp. NPDC006798 TaxID=3155462 RepID=UPI0033D9AF5B